MYVTSSGDFILPLDSIYSARHPVVALVSLSFLLIFLPSEPSLRRSSFEVTSIELSKYSRSYSRMRVITSILLTVSTVRSKFKTDLVAGRFKGRGGGGGR